MSTITDILKTAINLGACEKSSTATDWKSLCWLLFSPQGVEFCEKHNFPGIEQFRELESENLSDFGVFIDKGKISRINDSCIALVGNTRGELVFDDNTKVHKVIVMHGAEAFIVARNYAVVRLYNIGDNKVDVHRQATAVVLR